MMNVFAVGVGGAIGAMLRYGISLIPFPGEFPLATLVTNFLGALAIGILAAKAGQISPRAMLLLKTGVCGGFTTFSTFSLEAYTLFRQARYLLAGGYVLLSMMLCLAGVGIGLMLGARA